MDNSLHISQQSKLQLRLNPRQMMLGRLLEMSVPEFEEEVRKVVEENPALEAVSDAPSADVALPDNDFNETAEQLQMADFDEDDMPSYRLDTADAHDDGFQGYTAVSDHRSLFENMADQLSELDLTDNERKIALYIVGNLDDNGYMTRSLSDIADDIAISEGIGVDLADVRKVFALIRQLDPAGIAAVDLRDCLLLQIDRHKNSLTVRIAREIINDWFDLFSKKHFEQLQTHLGIGHDELVSALRFIRSLNPKPGALLEESSVQDRLRHIVPDFAVDIDDNGNAVISLLGNIPELAIEESFRIDNIPPKTGRRYADAYSFIKRRHDDAAAFISLMRMRSDTLMTVMRAIVTIQHRFFVSDDKADIRPMIIRDIADMTGLNISVISRAAAGKYVLTAHGVYPLKMFFNERPGDDSDISSHEIFKALSDIISSEDKTHPLSDIALTRRLAALGYDIARRTVTKYRERLGFPVARLRKHF